MAIDEGGDGASLLVQARVCAIVAEACGASALILAMHYSQLACLIWHAERQDFGSIYRQHACRHQLLLASCTSEAGKGGRIEQSSCAAMQHGDRVHLRKAASVVSYGFHADGFLITARRSPEAAQTDQILALVLRGECTLKKVSDWHTLGMRGTCSVGIDIEADFAASQVFTDRFSSIRSQTMIPFAHILWASVWLGICSSAIETTRQFVRTRVSKDKRQPELAGKFVEVRTRFEALSSLVMSAARRVDEVGEDRAKLCTPSNSFEISSLKLRSSEEAKSIVLDCLQICGLDGYRTNNPHSLDRQIRDVLSATLMVNNLRIRETLHDSAVVIGPERWDDF